MATSYHKSPLNKPPGPTRTLLSYYSDKKTRNHPKVSDVNAFVSKLKQENPTLTKVIDFHSLGVLYEKPRPVIVEKPAPPQSNSLF